jgi:hypothetical protein
MVFKDSQSIIQEVLVSIVIGDQDLKYSISNQAPGVKATVRLHFTIGRLPQTILSSLLPF